MNDALIVSLLSVVPKNPAARVIGAGARLRLPRAFHRALLRWFVKKYQVDLSECEGGIDDFDSLSHFFVRALKPGMRPVDLTPDLLVSPVDARVHTFGDIVNGSFVQSDGKRASIGLLLGVGDPRTPGVPQALADRYEGGSYAVLYLSPKDYHRVHTPREGAVTTTHYLPGRLWPVFPAATQAVDNLFGVNERLVFLLDTDLGQIAQVMVGAFGVGRMRTVIDDAVSNTGGSGVVRQLQAPVHLDRAAELGRFELGSTVILLLEPGRIDWLIEPGQPVRLGRPIARRRADPERLETEEA